MSTMKEKMHTGELYLPGDEEITARQLKCLDKLYDFNMTRPTELEKREEMLKEMFAEIGEGCYIEPPFYANFGGAHIHFGKNIYCNFGVTMTTRIYMWAIIQCSDLRLRLQRRVTLFCLSLESRHTSIMRQCI